jgi:hypothetical protein
MAPLRKLQRFGVLPREEKALFIRALAMIPMVDIELRLLGWRSCHARLEANARRSAADVAAPRIAPQRVAWLVDRAARNVPWPATCLRRSLVLWALLERSGTPSELRLGARKEGGAFEIHSWVEFEGVPLNERFDIASRYAAFDEALAPGEWREA